MGHKSRRLPTGFGTNPTPVPPMYNQFIINNLNSEKPVEIGNFRKKAVLAHPWIGNTQVIPRETQE